MALKIYRCECFQKLNGKPTERVTENKIQCPYCKKIQYIDCRPIDYAKIIDNERRVEKQ